MKYSLAFFLAFDFGGILISEVSEDVYVTGSVIKNLLYWLQIQYIHSIKKILEKRGTLHIENYLSFLPQINPSNSIFHSNKATGTSSVSLRGLGGTRTLILLNGKRLSPGSL